MGHAAGSTWRRGIPFAVGEESSARRDGILRKPRIPPSVGHRHGHTLAPADGVPHLTEGAVAYLPTFEDIAAARIELMTQQGVKPRRSSRERLNADKYFIRARFHLFNAMLCYPNYEAAMVIRLNQKCLDILHACSVKDFSKQIISFAQDLGFGTVAATVVTDHSPTLTEFQTISNVPAGYLKEFESLALGSIDPVSQHCKRSNAPIVWDRKTYAEPETRSLWEMQAPFGYRSGIAIGMHFGRGRHFMFGAEWNHETCESVSNFRNIFEDILTFSEHAQAAAFELSGVPYQCVDDDHRLSNSELEALRWTMDGKTSWEIAKLMFISERHATLQLARAMRKLNCSSKYETVLRAIKLGLIECS